MSLPYDLLFAPLTIKRVTLRNRIVCPPMVQIRSIVSKEGIAWYRRLAAGGVSLVIVEATGVPLFGAELTVDNLRRLTDAVHAEGAAVAIQLFPVPFGESIDPNALTTAQIEDIIDQFGRTATICREAGFDGVEPHGAHGYMINQMFMPDKNSRTDRFGGSLENRSRLGIEIVRTMRRTADDRLLILYRHTPEGAQYTIDDSLQFAAGLIDAGLDVLDISPARKEIPADLAAPFKAKFAVPVIAVQGMDDPAAAAEALRARRCDLIAVGRQLIADATWPRKVQQGNLADLVKCDKCNTGCFGRLREHKPVECVHWKPEELSPYMK
jgi:2,4-dienoyl-CoA reductase-like NADH-dependent reductase (Old Yellow Enzyme family)